MVSRTPSPFGANEGTAPSAGLTADRVGPVVSTRIDPLREPAFAHGSVASMT